MNCKRKPVRGRGEIRADCLYPLQTFLLRLGIGRGTLTTLRKQGLPVHILGKRRVFIDGSEAVATLRRLWGQQEDDGRETQT